MALSQWKAVTKNRDTVSLKKRLNMLGVTTVTEQKDKRILMPYTHLKAQDLMGRSGRSRTRRKR